MIYVMCISSYVYSYFLNLFYRYIQELCYLHQCLEVLWSVRTPASNAFAIPQHRNVFDIMMAAAT